MAVSRMRSNNTQYNPYLWRNRLKKHKHLLGSEITSLVPCHCT